MENNGWLNHEDYGKNMVMILKIDENWLFNRQQIAPN
jgi:hypothetical protein